MTEKFLAAIENDAPMMYGIAFRLLGNSHDAEDAVQDALLSAWKHLGEFRGEAKLSTWLGTIVRNHALMQLRRRRDHLSLDVPATSTEIFAHTLPCRAPTPEQSLAKTQMKARIAVSLDKLTPTLRTAIQLRDIEERSIEESARILNIPLGTMKARTSRARMQLARMVGAA